MFLSYLSGGFPARKSEILRHYDAGKACPGARKACPEARRERPAPPFLRMTGQQAVSFTGDPTGGVTERFHYE